MSKSQNAVIELLANVESSLLNKVQLIIDNQGTTTDVEKYCKLMEHTINELRNAIDLDNSMMSLIERYSEKQGVNAATPVENCQDYIDCLKHMGHCLELVPNLLERSDLRSSYYSQLLNPQAEINYAVLSVSLASAVVKLNRGRAYTGKAEVVEKPAKKGLWQWSLS